MLLCSSLGNPVAALRLSEHLAESVVHEYDERRYVKDETNLFLLELVFGAFQSHGGRKQKY
jgi:hypothetical protein